MAYIQNSNLLKAKRTRPTIGFITDWLGTPYHEEIMEGIIEASERYDINCLTFVIGRYKSQWTSERSRNILLEFVTEQNVDGLIITASSIGNLVGYSEMRKMIQELSFLPIITIGENYPGIPSVSIDNNSGIKMVMDHLINKHGHKRFAYLSGTPDNQDSQSRFTYFSQILSDNNIELNKKFIYEGFFRKEDGHEFVNKIWKKYKKEIDVIVCANDAMALGVLQALKSMQVDIPGEVAVTGFDDNEFSRYANLTTVYQSFYNQGKISVKNLLSIMNNETIDERTKYIPKLIVRESCGCMSSPKLKSSPKKFPQIAKSVLDNAIDNQAEVVHKILNSVNNLKEQTTLLKTWIEDLYVAYLRELENPGQDHFLLAWRKIIAWTTEQENMIPPLQEVLKVFNSLFEELKLPEQYYREIIMDRAYRYLDDVIQYTLTYKKILFIYQLEAIDETGERIISDLDRAKQLSIIEQDFPALGVNRCYISIYENPEKPTQLSRLILAYDEDNNYPIDKRGIQFATTSLLPPGFLPTKKRYSLIVHSLFQGNHQIGFTIFDTAGRTWRTYEILRHKISMAFKASELFKEIHNYTETLEEQVAERTKELQEANNLLKTEIKERKKIEEELKRQEAHYRELALLLPTIIIELDLLFRIVFINQSGQELLGLSEKEAFKLDNFIDHIFDDDEEYAEEYLTKIIKSGRSAYSEFRVIDENEEKTTILSHACPVIKNERITGIRISAMRIKPLLSSIIVPEDLFFEHYSFSPRVKEVLLLLLQGYKAKGIAEKLFIAESTVKAHIRALYTEVGVTNRSEFFKILEEYQIQKFGYQSYIYSLLSKLIRD